MSSNVTRHIPLLKIINAVPKKVRESILKQADDNFIKAICEICINFCNGNVKVNAKSFKKLKKYKDVIHKLASVKKAHKNLRKEKKVLIQKGGAFLPILLPSIISALTSIILEK